MGAQKGDGGHDLCAMMNSMERPEHTCFVMKVMVPIAAEVLRQKQEDRRNHPARPRRLRRCRICRKSEELQDRKCHVGRDHKERKQARRSEDRVKDRQFDVRAGRRMEIKLLWKHELQEAAFTPAQNPDDIDDQRSGAKIDRR